MRMNYVEMESVKLDVKIIKVANPMSIAMIIAGNARLDVGMMKVVN